MTLGVKGHWRAKQSETSEWQKVHYAGCVTLTMGDPELWEM